MQSFFTFNTEEKIHAQSFIVNAIRLSAGCDRQREEEIMGSGRAVDSETEK